MLVGPDDNTVLTNTKLSSFKSVHINPLECILSKADVMALAVRVKSVPRNGPDFAMAFFKSMVPFSYQDVREDEEEKMSQRRSAVE